MLHRWTDRLKRLLNVPEPPEPVAVVDPGVEPKKALTMGEELLAAMRPKLGENANPNSILLGLCWELLAKAEQPVKQRRIISEIDNVVRMNEDAPIAMAFCYSELGLCTPDMRLLWTWIFALGALVLSHEQRKAYLTIDSIKKGLSFRQIGDVYALVYSDPFQSTGLGLEPYRDDVMEFGLGGQRVTMPVGVLRASLSLVKRSESKPSTWDSRNESFDDVFGKYPLEGSSRAVLKRITEGGHGHWVLNIQGAAGSMQEQLAEHIMRILGVPFQVGPDRYGPGIGWITPAKNTDVLGKALQHPGPTILLSQMPKELGDGLSGYEPNGEEGEIRRKSTFTIRMAKEGSDEYYAWMLRRFPEGVAMGMDETFFRALPVVSPENFLGFVEKSLWLLKDEMYEFMVSAFRSSGQAKHLSTEEVIKTEPAVARMEDLVLPDETRTELLELCSYIRLEKGLGMDWGLNSGLLKHTFRNFLFYGPSGTGKTMAAEAVAKELGMAFRVVDGGKILGRYYGDTERNMQEAFAPVKPGDPEALVLLDEAEGFLMSREDIVGSSAVHERRWVNDLLRMLEHFKGVAVLTTNHEKGIDSALMRRLGKRIEFKEPDAAVRLGIWRKIWSDKIPVKGEIDFVEISNRFKLSGGFIRQAFVSACAAAAVEGVMTQDLLVKACEKTITERKARIGFSAKASMLE